MGDSKRSRDPDHETRWDHQSSPGHHVIGRTRKGHFYNRLKIYTTMQNNQEFERARQLIQEKLHEETQKLKDIKAEVEVQQAEIPRLKAEIGTLETEISTKKKKLAEDERGLPRLKAEARNLESDLHKVHQEEEAARHKAAAAMKDAGLHDIKLR